MKLLALLAATAALATPAGYVESQQREDGGFGDAQITARGEKISGGGFVSHSATWEGDGTFHIEVSVGVGDAVITLD